jgi:hypothetical protein
MAYALLTDDASRFRKAVSLFQNTTADYLRWGKGADAAGRVLGECSETLRDIYHSGELPCTCSCILMCACHLDTCLAVLLINICAPGVLKLKHFQRVMLLACCAEFGMGGLIQVAEMAWQQDMDLYSASDFALASMMELHARIINAWDANKDESLLPLGFRWVALAAAILRGATRLSCCPVGGRQAPADGLFNCAAGHMVFCMAVWQGRVVHCCTPPIVHLLPGHIRTVLMVLMALLDFWAADRCHGKCTRKFTVLLHMRTVPGLTRTALGLQVV